MTLEWQGVISPLFCPNAVNPALANKKPENVGKNMTEARLILDQLESELGQMKNLPLVPWQNANRAQLLERLKAWHAHTKTSAEYVRLLQMEQLKYPAFKDVNIQEAETHLKKSTEVLERNISFEKDKTNRRVDLAEKITTPALGAELEARMHRQWLALHRLHEQFHLALRKGMDPNTSTSKRVEGDLFSLVRTKDAELQKMTQERDTLKREKYFGANEKYSLTEMENDLQEMLQQFAIEKHGVFDHLTEGKKKLDEYGVHHLHLESKTKKLEHLVTELTKKHVNILSLLKKERDYARKLAIDLESETASLRALYSKELLTLEDKKHAMKQEIEEKHAHQIATLERKTREQESIIREMEVLVREKERQIARDAERNPGMPRAKTEQSVRDTNSNQKNRRN